MPSRNPNRASSIYKGRDGFWHGRVTVGWREDGTSDRRHVQAQTKGAVVQKVRALEKERDQGGVRKPGSAWTVGAWLRHWLENVVGPGLRPTSYSAYRVAIEHHLIPAFGKQRLDRLEPEHLEAFYRRIVASGKKPATAHQVHRTIRAALNEANRRGYLTRNPAALAKPPRVEPEPVEPYSVAEVQQILAAADSRRNGARWAIALALGLRQGEALALRWQDVELDTGTLRIRWTRLRPHYAHGCGATCGRKAGRCPHRRQVGPDIDETKSRAGRRVLGLPEELIRLLERHRVTQDQERAAARQLWQDGGWVFATPMGRPINPNTDYREWKSLLRQARVRDARLHDARHTAATVLLLLGVPERTAMGIMGWSSAAMTSRYQHLIDPVRRDVAGRLGRLLWGETEPPGS